MGNFRSDDRGFRRDRFSGRSSGGFGDRRSGGRGFRDRDSDRRKPEMHDVICDKCKKECQVPFKPTGDKPVLCSDCFRQGGNSSSKGSLGMSQDQFKEINTKLDKILTILESMEVIEEDFEDEEETQ